MEEDDPITAIMGIAALASAGAGIGGVVEGAQAGNRQQKALTQQEQIAQQEQGDKQKIFEQLQPFFMKYLTAGSPFLSQIQSAAAGQNAQQTGNAAGRFREEMQTTGLGYGPSGTTAAGLGEIGAQGAQTGTSNYLQNLLNNEQVKFQAAQGLTGLGSMAGSPQNQPNVSAQLPFQSLGSGLSGLGQVLQNLLKQIPGGSSAPSPGTNTGPGLDKIMFPGIPGLSSGGPPPTQGTSLEF